MKFSGPPASRAPLPQDGATASWGIPGSSVGTSTFETSRGSTSSILSALDYTSPLGTSQQARVRQVVQIMAEMTAGANQSGGLNVMMGGAPVSPAGSMQTTYDLAHEDATAIIGSNQITAAGSSCTLPVTAAGYMRASTCTSVLSLHNQPQLLKRAETASRSYSNGRSMIGHGRVSRSSNDFLSNTAILSAAAAGDARVHAQPAPPTTWPPPHPSKAATEEDATTTLSHLVYDSAHGSEVLLEQHHPLAAHRSFILRADQALAAACSSSAARAQTMLASRMNLAEQLRQLAADRDLHAAASLAAAAPSDHLHSSSSCGEDDGRQMAEDLQQQQYVEAQMMKQLQMAWSIKAREELAAIGRGNYPTPVSNMDTMSHGGLVVGLEEAALQQVQHLVGGTVAPHESADLADQPLIQPAGALAAQHHSILAAEEGDVDLFQLLNASGTTTPPAADAEDQQKMDSHNHSHLAWARSDASGSHASFQRGSAVSDPAGLSGEHALVDIAANRHATNIVQSFAAASAAALAGNNTRSRRPPALSTPAVSESLLCSLTASQPISFEMPAPPSISSGARSSTPGSSSITQMMAMSSSLSDVGHKDFLDPTTAPSASIGAKPNAALLTKQHHPPLPHVVNRAKSLPVQPAGALSPSTAQEASQGPGMAVETTLDSSNALLSTVASFMRVKPGDSIGALTLHADPGLVAEVSASGQANQIQSLLHGGHTPVNIHGAPVGYGAHLAGHRMPIMGSAARRMHTLLEVASAHAGMGQLAEMESNEFEEMEACLEAMYGPNGPDGGRVRGMHTAAGGVRWIQDSGLLLEPNEAFIDVVGMGSGAAQTEPVPRPHPALQLVGSPSQALDGRPATMRSRNSKRSVVSAPQLEYVRSASLSMAGRERDGDDGERNKRRRLKSADELQPSAATVVDGRKVQQVPSQEAQPEVSLATDLREYRGPKQENFTTCGDDQQLPPTGGLRGNQELQPRDIDDPQVDGGVGSLARNELFGGQHERELHENLGELSSGGDSDDEGAGEADQVSPNNSSPDKSQGGASGKAGKGQKQRKDKRKVSHRVAVERKRRQRIRHHILQLRDALPPTMQHLSLPEILEASVVYINRLKEIVQLQNPAAFHATQSPWR